MRRITTLIVVLAAALTCAIAVAATTQTYSQKFTTTHPGRETATTLKWYTFHGAHSQLITQPKTVTLTFPKGMKIDPGAVRSGGNLGSGMATFGQGTPPRPITIVNRTTPGHVGDGITLVISNSVGISYSLKAQYAGMGTQLVIPVPTFRIPPAVLTGISVVIKGGSTHRPYLKTPSICPSSKAWKFSATFVYPAGTPTQVLNSTSACVKH
jgi:hypothetical protein